MFDSSSQIMDGWVPDKGRVIILANPPQRGDIKIKRRVRIFTAGHNARNAERKN